MALLVKYLPCNHEEDLSSNPEPYKTNLVAHACNPSAGEVETSGSLGPEKQDLANLASYKSMRDPARKSSGQS